MRNLKRALSLALASVMVLGMMVIGAGAVSYNDFTDKDEITNVDAVSMVTELGIINGLPNNTFGPTQNIDRASFVKMVALAYNGGNEPMLPSGAKVSYVDTAGTWASQYIEYCTNLGFVAGDGATGKFNPTDSVTVAQGAKMLLVALGYNANNEKYIGLDWQINVDAAANTSRLYDGLTGTTSAPLTRDNAAQMIYNVLNANTVKYELAATAGANGQLNMVPQVVEVLRNEKPVTLLEAKFNAVKVTGTVVANEYAGVDAGTTDEGKTNIVITDMPDGTKLDNGTFKVASTPDMLGKSVTMFVKPGVSSKDASKATVLGALIVSDSNKVVELTTKKETPAKIDTFLKDNKLKLSDASEYYVNYNLQLNGTKNVAPAANYAGMVMTFIDNNDDGKVDFVLHDIKTFGQVTSHITTGDGSIYVGAVNPSTEVKDFSDDYVIEFISNKDAIDEVNGFEDVEKDDFVFFYKIAGELYVEKAEFVDATVTAKKGDTITADGTSYSMSGLVSGVNDDNQTLYNAATVGDDIRLYLDAAGKVVHTDAVDKTVNYLFVKASDNYNSFRDTVEAKVVFADGTSSTINVNAEDSKPAIGNGKPVDNDAIYTYTKNSKDVYTLTKVVDNDTTSTAFVNDITEIEQGKAVLPRPASEKRVLANGSTTFVVARGSGYTVYTGINKVPDLEGTVENPFHAYAVVKDGVAKVVFVTSAKIGGDIEGIYVLNKDPEVTIDKGGDEIYTYTVVYKGEKTTLIGDNGLFNKDAYYSDVNVNNGEITGGAKTMLPPQFATRASNSLVAAKDANGLVTTYSYTDETKFILVEDEDVTAVSAGAIVIAPKGQEDINDYIVVVETEAGSGVAQYVFICR